MSEQVLRASAEAIAARYPSIGVHGIVGDFERHLSAIPAGGCRLIAFLGSTVGNLTRTVAPACSGPWPCPRAGRCILLGIDLVKDPALIEAAYNDSQGVTERFVRNGLTVVNRILRGDFEQSRFVFESRWDADREWMDIGFRSRDAQTVRIEELETELEFAAGEQLRFEVSTKFRRDGIEPELVAFSGCVRRAGGPITRAASRSFSRDCPEARQGPTPAEREMAGVGPARTVGGRVGLG